MDDDLIRRLLLAESDFLVALRNGPQMLGSYRQTLAALPNVLSTATKNGDIGAETLLLANSVSSRISKIASCFLDVKHEEDISTVQLHRDCDAMFQSMTSLNLDSGDMDTRSAHSPKPTLKAGSSPYPPAYQWLLENLHNPYPTVEVKTRIAAASHCQVSAINSWFTNARRRIGWTTLCREYFPNCKADMLDAAYRALVEEDPQRMLSPALRHTFITMKAMAENLYSSAFSMSAFITNLEAEVVARDMKDRHKEFAEVGNSQVEQASLEKTIGHSYPSLDQLVPASPVPALDAYLTDESEEEDEVAPPIIAGSKRRRSSAEPANQLPSAIRRPTKRLRSVPVTSQSHLPSPPTSTDGDGSPRVSSLHPIQSGANEVLPSRKRLFSDADATVLLERPHGSMTATPHHVVSNPLPCFDMGNEFPIDDWLNTSFDSLFAIPPPAETTEPDSSASWEVELFRDYNIPENHKYAPECPSAPTADTYISAMSDLSELDCLLQSIANDTFVTASQIVPPSDTTGASYMTSPDSSTPDISHIDWMSLLNDLDTYQSTIDPAFSQNLADTQPLQDVNLSMLQLPLAMPAAQSQGDSALKLAKLDQLHAMQEAVRRMEQELQSEGIII